MDLGGVITLRCSPTEFRLSGLGLGVNEWAWIRVMMLEYHGHGSMHWF